MTYYCVVKSRTHDPFVVESHEFDTKADFIGRVVDRLTDSSAACEGMVSFSLEFIFPEVQ